MLIEAVIFDDHKNMVNRLNNCEIANQEKTTSTGLKQLELIQTGYLHICSFKNSFVIENCFTSKKPLLALIGLG